MASRPSLIALALLLVLAVAGVLFALTRGGLQAPSHAGFESAQNDPPPTPRPDVALLDAPRAAHEASRDAEISAVDAAPARETVPAPENALTVRGRLVGPDGAGVPEIDAYVTIAYYLDAAGEGVSLGDASNPSEFFAHARSGPDGAFEFAALTGIDGQRITAFQFVCRPDGRASITRWTNVPEGQRVVELGDLALLPGATIAGFVRDVAGLAIAGARVQVNVLEGDNGWKSHGESTQSDSSGAFRLDHAPARRISLAATSPDDRASERFEATLQPGELRENVELLMPLYEDARAISGTVYDVDGAPLANAPLQWSAKLGERGSSSGSRQAGKDGRFRLSAPEGAIYRVTASHPDGTARQASRRDLVGGTHGIELRLTPALELPLRVRATGGAPVARFTYQVDVHLGSHTQGGMKIESPAETPGEARIVAPSDPFVVRVQAEGFASAETEPFDPETLPIAIEVELVPLPELRGRVVANGQPVSGARVRAFAGLARNQSRTADVFDLAVAPCEACTDATTGADGSFVVNVERAGWWCVRVAADGHPATRSDVVEVATGRTTVPLLVDVGPRGAIAGHVRDAQGAPLARQTVGASCGDGTPVTAVSGADGAYRIEPLAPGSWQVRVLDPDRATRLQSSSTESDEDAKPIAWDCRVSDGTATKHDLVVSKP